MKLTLAILSLVFVAVASGVMWRMEVDHHGWAGLIWLEYFHLAVPAAFLLCLAWANCFVQLPILRRVLLNILALVFGVMAHHFLAQGFAYLFVTGPSAMMIYMTASKTQFILMRFSAFITMPFLPIGTYLIMRLFGLEVKARVLLISIALMFVSIVVSVGLLDGVGHRGSHDFIHAIKSGFLAPCWVMSIGLLILNHVYLMQQRRSMIPVADSGEMINHTQEQQT